MAAMGQVVLSQALLSAETKDREFEAAVREHARYVYRVAQAVLAEMDDVASTHRYVFEVKVTKTTE